MPMAAVAVSKSMSYQGGSTFRATTATPPGAMGAMAGAMAGATMGATAGMAAGFTAAILKY